MCCKRQPLRFLLETGPVGPERIQILRHLDGAFDWLSVSSFVYWPIRMSRLLLFSALNYLFSAPSYLKTAFLLANHNREIFSCILLGIWYDDSTPMQPLVQVPFSKDLHYNTI